MNYRFDTNGESLTMICHPSICNNAVFRLDKPLRCTIDDVFTLRNGQWFIAGILLNGMWINPVQESIAEKDMKR